MMLQRIQGRLTEARAHSLVLYISGSSHSSSLPLLNDHDHGHGHGHGSNNHLLRSHVHPLYLAVQNKHRGTAHLPRYLTHNTITAPTKCPSDVHPPVRVQEHQRRSSSSQS